MKGQFRTIEAVIATSILVTLLIVFSHKVRPTHKLSMLGYKLDAYNALRLLEETGQLRQDALNANVASIERKLQSFIKTNYQVVVFNKTTNLNPLPDVPAKQMIVSCCYIAGDVGKYSPRKVCVYMWGFE